MAQLMLSPSTNVLSIGTARGKRTTAKNSSDNLPVTLRLPLPLTPQRLELIKALAREMWREPAERTAQHPPRQLILAQKDLQVGKKDPPSQVSLVLPRKLWALLSAVILVALLPNLTLAPIFWLRFFDKPVPTSSHLTANLSSADHLATPVTLSANRTSIDNPLPVASPVLSGPSVIDAIVGEEMSLLITIDGTDGMPASSKIVIRGLPPGSKLSNGRPDNDAEWSLKPEELGDLHLMLRDNVTDESPLTIQLVTPEGHVLAETATIIKRAIEPEASAVFTATGAQPMEIQVSSEQTRQLEVVGVAEKTDPEMSTADPASAGRRAKAENDAGAKWVKPSTSVNLRKGPSASTSIIGVVDRGTKLREIARKKGWVQVSNPASSEKGWIYAGKLEDAR
jgi:Bacterial SH3 domain